MSRRIYMVQAKPMSSPIWGDTDYWYDTRREAVSRFFAIDDAIGEGESREFDDDWDLRAVVRLQPCANAPIVARCQVGIMGEECQNMAVVDAPYMGSSWAYQCEEHWLFGGSTSPELINVLVERPLDLAVVGQ